MGNCQAIDTATLVIQHPSGKSDNLYWPVSAAEVMKMNPGHYVALLISTTFCPTSSSSGGGPSSSGNRPSVTTKGRAAAAPAAPGSSVRVTRIKLLRPTDTLMLGQVYRLITSQEVMKVLSAKKHAKMKKGQQQESMEKLMGSDLKIDSLVGKHERQRNQKTATTTKTTTTSSSSAGTPRPRTWQPSLHSISEAAS